MPFPPPFFPKRFIICARFAKAHHLRRSDASFVALDEDIMCSFVSVSLSFVLSHHSALFSLLFSQNSVFPSKRPKKRKTQKDKTRRTKSHFKRH
jgi:hypothetical protein